MIKPQKSSFELTKEPFRIQLKKVEINYLVALL